MAESPFPVFTVTQLTEAISDLFRDQFKNVSVEGEISGWKVASSGHAYFSLKDQGALLKAVMWRSRLDRLSTMPADGQLVRATGTLTVYPPRGEYQIDVNTLAQAGVGLLQKRFEELKQKLAEEGLFEAGRKRRAPFHIRRVVVITSPTGAALHDFLRVLDNRETQLGVLILPVRVQGVDAPGEIVEALRRAPEWNPDLVVLTRGGGSLEDLWSFNEEAVARAVAGSPVPVLCAVGHEVDFSIADFVADIRASTPTAAAHFLADSVAGVCEAFEDLGQRLGSAMRDYLADLRADLNNQDHRLAARSPLSFIPFHRQRLDDLLAQSHRALARSVDQRRNQIASMRQTMFSETRMDLVRWRGRLHSESERLLVLNPASTLARGYALVETAAGKHAIRRLADIPKKGDIRVHLADGAFEATPKAEGVDGVLQERLF